MPSVYIIEGNGQYSNLFKMRGWDIADSLNKADLVQFTGGADVDPKLYQEMPHPKTHSDFNRDVREQALFKLAAKLGKPMAGICRGAQFLHVMNGGSLVQDLNNHAIYGKHAIFDTDGKFICDVTSTHHQAMAQKTKYARYKTIAVAFEATKVAHHVKDFNDKGEEEEFFTDLDANIKPSSFEKYHNCDLEVVVWPKTKSLCFQPHPEHEPESKMADFYFSCIQKHLLGLAGAGAGIARPAVDDDMIELDEGADEPVPNLVGHIRGALNDVQHAQEAWRQLQAANEVANRNQVNAQVVVGDWLGLRRNNP